MPSSGRKYPIQDAFEIRIEEPPEHDLERESDVWVGKLYLSGEFTGVESRLSVQRFCYASPVQVIDELMVGAMREFARRWRVAANAEKRLEDIEEQVALLTADAAARRILPW